MRSIKRYFIAVNTAFNGITFELLPLLLLGIYASKGVVVELNKVELVNLYFYTFVMASLDSMFLHKDYNKGFALFYWFYMLVGVCFILFTSGYYKLISTTFIVQPLLHYCQFYGEMYDFKKSVKFKLAKIYLALFVIFNFYAKRK